MNILYIHNDYAKPSGEEHAAETIVDLLRQNGHTVRWYRRSSAELMGSWFGRVKGFFAGMYNPVSARTLEASLEDFRPDVVQVQNIYPLISASIFPVLKRKRLPVVMRCPNYRLFCPNGRHLVRGEVCERCRKAGWELWCILRNCEEDLLKSTGYAMRNAIARITRIIIDNVDIFIVQSQFQRSKFIKNGIDETRVEVLPGIAPDLPINRADEPGKFVTFVGRASPEKGIEDFLEAARILPEIPFAVAAEYNRFPQYRENASSNVKWLGFLKGEKLNRLFLDSRIVIVPSRWYEGFPNVVIRAMMYGRPVVASDIGALSNIVNHNRNGLLFKPKNAKDLAEKIVSLCHDPDSCRTLGDNGSADVRRLYSRQIAYTKLIRIYERAIFIS